MEIKSFKNYLIPSLVATVFLATYVIFDGIFIGVKLSDLGLSAINIGWPVVAILHSMGIGLGISAGIYISRKNGEGKYDEANKAKLTSIIILLILGIVFTTIIFFLKKPLIYLFGADDVVYPYADEYLTTYLLFGGSLFVIGPALIPLLKNSGKSKMAMIASISSVILNFTLDYIFIIVLDMGLKGAALASILGQLSCVIIALFSYYKEFDGVSFNKQFIKKFFIGGIAPYVLNFSYDIILIITNRVCGYFNGNEAIATYALLTYALYVVNAICQGVGDGIQPMFSYYSGKNDKKMLRKLVMKSLIVSFIVNSIFITLFIIFRYQIAKLFNLSDVGLNIFKYASIFYGISFFMISISKVIASYFYSVNRNLYANIMTIIEPFILTPLCYLLCIPFGIDAIWWSYLIIQSILFILSIFLYIRSEMKLWTASY